LPYIFALNFQNYTKLSNNTKFVTFCLMFKQCPIFSLPLYLVATGLRTIQFLLRICFLKLSIIGNFITQGVLWYGWNQELIVWALHWYTWNWLNMNCNVPVVLISMQYLSNSKNIGNFLRYKMMIVIFPNNDNRYR
jgi:hypothetical protein